MYLAYQLVPINNELYSDVVKCSKANTASYHSFINMLTCIGELTDRICNHL